MFDGAQNLMPVGEERIIAGPEALDDLHSRIFATGVDGDEPPSCAQGARERSDHPPRLEVRRGPSAIGLRSDDQVKIGLGTTRSWNDRIKQKAMVLTVNHQHHGTLIDGI